jgi:hypothetical protein
MVTGCAFGSSLFARHLTQYIDAIIKYHLLQYEIPGNSIILLLKDRKRIIWKAIIRLVRIAVFLRSVIRGFKLVVEVCGAKDRGSKL